MTQVGTDNKSIKLPTSFYVGFNVRNKDEIPLGFLTPDGSDASALKRKATVDSWAAQSGEKIPATTIQNESQVGFKLGRSVRHGYGWNSGVEKIRIEDPRGFECEITAANLLQILHCSTVQEGEILDACVWGRLGANNILVPVSSDVYKLASVNTERMQTKVSSKDIKPGDHIVLQNGDEGRYLGDFFVLEIGGYYYQDNLELKCSTKKKLAFQEKDGSVNFVTSPKLSSFVPGDNISNEQGRDICNANSLKKKALLKPLQRKEFKLVEVDIPTSYLNKSNTYGSENYFVYKDGKLGKFKPAYLTYYPDHLHYLDEQQLLQGKYVWFRLSHTSVLGYKDHYISDHGRKLGEEYDRGDVKQWYRMCLVVTDTSGQTFETLI